jgi:sulfate transport system ATP-binding protein
MTVIVENLSKSFGPKGDAAAAVGISFVAPPGKVTSLLGPSGSGKTTLLRLIAGLEEPDGGTIVIDGTDCTKTPARLRGVGFVFQSYALFGHMSVRENIAFGLRVRGARRSEIDARVVELLELVQLPGLERRLPRELSGGQRQRVALARALAPKPRLLLLDEPFGALDARVRTELRDWLMRLHDRTRVTTLLVTHDQEEALELSEHVVLLRDGKVVQAGSPHELYDRPATPFVASFLGGSNVLRGHVWNGRADVGSVHVDAPEGARDGAAVNAFIRPHDVRIAKATDAAAGVVSARIERIARIGGQAKITLRLASRDVMMVQLTRLELDGLGVESGDRVLLDLKQAKVFLEDYVI